MAKIKLKPGCAPYPNPEICWICAHYVSEGGESGAHRYRCGSKLPNCRISSTECEGFSPDRHAQERYDIDYSFDYIGISENRMKHILAVARKAYQLAKDRGNTENFARRMFMAGWLHDVGYEFSGRAEYHQYASGELIKDFFDIKPGTVSSLPVRDYDYGQNKAFNAVTQHGKHVKELTEEYIILNTADMLIDSEGREVSVTERLREIREMYGKYSSQYLTSCDICQQIGLTKENLAGDFI